MYQHRITIKAIGLIAITIAHINGVSVTMCDKPQTYQASQVIIIYLLYNLTTSVLRIPNCFFRETKWNVD